jgi:hypothetical protein
MTAIICLTGLLKIGTLPEKGWWNVARKRKKAREKDQRSLAQGPGGDHCEADRCWWMKAHDWDDLTPEEQGGFLESGGGFHPKLQDEYFEIVRPEFKDAYDYARKDIWGRLINLGANRLCSQSSLQNETSLNETILPF